MSKLLIPSILSAATVATMSLTNVSAAGVDSTLNHPSYWGDNCVKTEMKGDVKTYTATGDDIVKVIVKGGTENAVYTDGNFTDLTAPVNPKSGKPFDISHVIVCYGTETTPDDEEPATPGVGGDNDGVIDTDDQDTANTTTAPQVLGTTTGRGGQTPDVLPETGSNSTLFTLIAGLVVSGTAYAFALRHQTR